MTRTLPIILTPGEPSGIGPEIALLAWRQLRNEGALAFAMLGDIDHLRLLAGRLGLDDAPQPVATIGLTRQFFTRGLPILHRPLNKPVQAGSVNTGNSGWVVSCIEEAAEACLNGAASAMVTNPIQKDALYASGFTHQGHTDFLASIAKKNGRDATDVMMLVGGGLRAVPVTVHIPLKEVPRQLTKDAIIEHARIVAKELREKFGIQSPRLAVTGLNPHAGENGVMGREEIELIVPALATLKAEGLNIFGPVPADSAFTQDMRATYDAILCMYHDQALIPVKALDFHGSVNVTLGLPFIRTSPDHGTALAIAGTGKAKPDSLIAAIRLAVEMAERASGERRR